MTIMLSVDYENKLKKFIFALEAQRSYNQGNMQNKNIHFDDNDLALAVAYIEQMWPSLTKSTKNDLGTLIGLPYDYAVPSVVPSEDFVFDEMYYWDSFFIAKGLLATGRNELAEGILDNLCYLYKRFHIIPNASRFYLTARSQPPFLTSYIFDIYEANDKSIEWLKEKIYIAEQEYRNVWTANIQPNIRNVHNGLSRYYDINSLHDLAEAESGWDMTTRFEGQALNYIPIDLNCLLYKYEVDIARAYELFGEIDTRDVWLEKSKIRASQVSLELWDPKKGFFFDLNYGTGEHSEVMSLASYYALWCGLATTDQAEDLADSLDVFIKDGGLTTTTNDQSDDDRDIPKQWAYPNGWAPLHWIVVEGLEKYGYREQAEEVARKWLKTNLDYYKYFGVFREAYNVVEPLELPVSGVYPPQTGYGWTNGVFIDLAKKYLARDETNLI
jgi:alpha,alpha-trehalase